MAITYRDVKGSPLSPAEVDENFRSVVAQIDEVVANAQPGVGIASITQAGATFTVHLTDASTQGPFSIPTTSFRDTGDWAADQAYSQMDIFTVINDGLYLVVQSGYVSGDDFDPTVTNGDAQPYLKKIISTANGPQTLVAEDEDFTISSVAHTNCYVRVFGDALVTVTVPAESTEVVFHRGDTVVLRQADVGQLLIVAEGAVEIMTPESLLSRKTGATIVLTNVGVDLWDLSGDLEISPVAPTTTTGP